MLWEPTDSKQVYEHYSQGLTWLEPQEGECLGGALRSLHEITAALKTLDFVDKPTRLEDFERSTGIERLGYDGYDLRCETDFVLDSSVHGLQRLLKDLEVYQDEEPTPPALPYHNDYARLPDVDPLFSRGIILPEWMRFFRTLVQEYDNLDREICRRPITVSDIAALCFHAYLLAVSLHQALSIFAFAQANAPAENRSTQRPPADPVD